MNYTTFAGGAAISPGGGLITIKSFLERNPPPGLSEAPVQDLVRMLGAQGPFQGNTCGHRRFRIR